MPGHPEEIARAIVGHDADYVLCLKANHPPCGRGNAWFEQAEAANFAALEHSYDARWSRAIIGGSIGHVWAAPVAVMETAQIEQWAGLKTIVMVIAGPTPLDQITRETMVYLTSLPCDAAMIGQAIVH
jgi:hypothetical protein